MSEGLDLEAFLAMPRLLNLHVSPDGARLALTIQTVAADGKSFVGAIWEVPTTGDGAPRRLSRNGADETARGFTADGSLLLTAPRPAADGADAAQASGVSGEMTTGGGASREPHALYVLGPGDERPRLVVAPGAGVSEVLSARHSATVVVTTAMHPGSTTLQEDRAREQARMDAGVQARLVEHYPDRYWDHDIGPRQPRLLAIDLDGTDIAEPRDLTPRPPWAGWLEEVHLSLSEDGSRVAFGAQPNAGGHFKTDLAMVETMTESVVRVLVDADVQHEALAWSPDGSTIAVATTEIGAPDRPSRFHLVLVDAATGAVKEVAPGWEERALEVLWTRPADALLVCADQRGHTPVFRVGLDGTVSRLTAAGAYRNLALGPDGETLYAIRSHIDEPPTAVALDVRGSDQRPRPLPNPIPTTATGTRLEQITSAGDDGEAIHSWLVLPRAPAETPLPLAVLIHGGPISSWTGWHWRWSAALLAARGWAVLLPNPRLSTGYGHDLIAAAWTDWATLPAGDILAAMDAITARDDIDEGRIAALGGSYGGYMANWLAVTTDRFRAIVSHAGVWDLAMEHDTSDVGFFMERQFGDPRRDEDSWRHQSPHLRADALRTPMLVIHGARDQRVTVSNSHSLWLALQLRSVPSRLLVYPDENHWILKPQNARLWYQTVFAFLDEHVLGKPWEQPRLL
ncbi:MAG: S9 family peptidase [Candidatus Dormibacteraeota bacterium]|uniref:Acyl-peptide hydrolase n=1 Tax=Candidatus Aeolococcus gillhamiae TaxID=3127015 RepID=A0A934JYE8_9BACT|nr:S9 family peptidase [Candidatus Dormibacteraeota bacterium]